VAHYLTLCNSGFILVKKEGTRGRERDEKGFRACFYCLALTSPVLGTEPPLIGKSFAPIKPPLFLAFRSWSFSSYVRVNIPVNTVMDSFGLCSAAWRSGAPSWRENWSLPAMRKMTIRWQLSG